MHKLKSKYLVLAITFVMIALCYSCDKEESEAVTKSDRQKFEFVTSNAGFGVGCPTLVGDYIYIGTSSNVSYSPAPNNYFYKLDKSLTKIWEYPLGGKQLRGAASLDDEGNIYFVVDSGRTEAFFYNASNIIYSLDNNGKYRWSRNIGSWDDGGMKCLAISDDNTIYVGGDSLFAFDIYGNIKWTYYHISIPGGVSSAPIIDAIGNIYFRANDHVISLDKNGNKRWIYVTNDGGNSSPAFSNDYSSLIIAAYKTIYSLNTANGSLNWKYDFNMNADFRSTPALDDHNNIYIGSHGDGEDNDESTLYALKADGSELLWQFNLGSDMYSSPTLGNDRVIYIGSESHGNTDDKHNVIHAFDMTNGSRIWSAQLSRDVTWGSPILDNGGMLYVTTMYMPGEGSGGIYGFQTDATGLLPNCVSPTFQLSNAHNGRR